MTESTVEQFSYPTAAGTLRSVDEYRERFLPAYYDVGRYSLRVRRTLELLLRNTPDSPLRMLDYGCGAGTFAHQAAKHRPRWTVEGWEGDFSAWTVAREVFGLENATFGRKHYGAHAELDEPRFDVISFLEVIEHVDDPGDILRHFHAGLEPGGLLLVSTPNFMGHKEVTAEARRMARMLLGRTSTKQTVRDLNDRPYDVTSNEGHVVIYSLETLTNLLRLEGFELVDFDVVPASSKLLHRLLPATVVVLGRKVDRAP
jgi:2-polyprenyl-3-methyl-5-hydroxy-6-metoxy-1,4-benzoquinol methylase